ncbi:uncharacterized protein LOC110698009 [Chenopodium quinoa]|uniref:uncharacterized protein LOC110698009 n=1 Tax=Chenopodium quinoa TaxID=63459 RepID=UPI000B77AA87|nr:uncharacterized protein LOC110698009 [Chenopodium quinoa]
MAGGKDGELSRKTKGKGKAPAVVNDDHDEEMEDAKAHDLGATLELPFTHPQDQTQEHSELPVLDPTTFWFDNNKVRSAVSDMLTGYYRDPWRNYGEVDEGTKQHWWNLFSKQFTWTPQLNEHVKVTVERRFATRLRDMFHIVTHKMNGAKPGWLNEEVHKKMMDIVATDLTYKKRSAIIRRTEGAVRWKMWSNQATIRVLCQLSNMQKAKRMATKNKGQLPTALELFLKTHFKDVPGKGTVLVNTKAKKIAVITSI